MFYMKVVRKTLLPRIDKKFCVSLQDAEKKRDKGHNAPGADFSYR
jgi:hypothetical protein